MALINSVAHMTENSYLFSPSFSNGKPGVVVVIEVYMDESGVDAKSPAPTAATMWATPEVWRDWTAEWHSVLDPIQVFHSTDCNGFHEEWEGWSRADRDAKVEKLLPIIPKFGICGRVGGMHEDAITAELPIIPEKIWSLGGYYLLAVYWAINSACEAIEADGHSRIAFVHETSNYTGHVDNVFKLISKLRPNLTMSLSFGAKAAFPPLQAADIVAYEAHKFLKSEGKVRKSMEVLDPTGKRIMKLICGKDDAKAFADRISEIELLERQMGKNSSRLRLEYIAY